MSASVATVDWAPTLHLLWVSAAAAAALLAVLAWRSRRQGASARLAALTVLTAFLTFDLIVFGAFTRLTDSGLGCPDWPGCYGQASPIGAQVAIAAEEAARPTGPVTVTKAWIEMVHRYLAMTVGALILVLAIASAVWRKALPHSAGWAFATLVWVLVQGLFGKYTVTLKLYPAIVTAHLLGGMLLLALLVIQVERWSSRAPVLEASTRPLAGLATLALWVQIALGGWVSTNYAVLACPDFPTCHGRWWPDIDLAQGFVLLRPLGHTADGALLGFDALVGIHWVHRLFALVALLILGLLAWHLLRSAAAHARRAGGLLAGLLSLQLLSGLSNVVLGWPLLAALGHTAGAAALVALTTSLLARGHAVPSATAARAHDAVRQAAA